jgi:hypothetical protein
MADTDKGKNMDNTEMALVSAEDGDYQNHYNVYNSILISSPVWIFIRNTLE